MSEPGDNSAVVGEIAIGGKLVSIRTNDAELRRAIRWSHADLLEASLRSGPFNRRVELTVLRTQTNPIRWSILRDRQVCEETEHQGYALFHLQWELNRLVLESWPVTLHAAAIEQQGRTVVFPGASHSGKTTLTGWCVVHGWSYVADEVTAITAELRAVPYPRPLGLRHDGPLAEWITWPRDVPRTFGAYEQLVPVRALGTAAPTPTSERIACVVFPTLAGDRGEHHTRLTPAQACVRMCENSPGLVRHGKPVLERLAELARRVPAYVVGSSDLASAETTIARLTHTGS